MNEYLNGDFIEHFTSEIVTICESLKKSKYYFFREYWNILLCLLLKSYLIIIIYTLPGLKAVENYF